MYVKNAWQLDVEARKESQRLVMESVGVAKRQRRMNKVDDVEQSTKV